MADAREDMIDFLGTVPGFNTLDREDLAEVISAAEPRTLSDGEFLIRRGDMGDFMAVVHKGRVKVPLRDSGSGDTKMVVNLGAGDVVGEMAMLTGEPRNADVISVGTAEALILDRGVVEEKLRSNPGLAKFLTELLGRRLEQGGGIEWVGKYRLLGKIGEGATAKVYQGLHPGLNRVVAIKMLSHALVYDSSFKDRFLNEARTIASLTHPNIVQIFDTEAAYATYFIVMEKVSGTDLANVLKARKVLEPEEAMNILRQMAIALRYAHDKGIVHRDVKPANCAVDEEGQVKLMDFGIARRIPKSPTNKRAKIVEGTPRYLAPEAAIGKEVDGRADIYSLGIMAYEMVTGRVPFYSDTIRDLLRMHVRKRPPDITRIRSGLPPGLVEFVNGTLIKRPDERLTDWDDIERLLTPGGTKSKPRLTRRLEETDVLTVSYTSESAPQVRRAIETALGSLLSVPGVEVRHASAALVTGEGQRGKASAADAPAPERGNGEDAKSWFSRLSGQTQNPRPSQPEETKDLDDGDDSDATGDGDEDSP